MIYIILYLISVKAQITFDSGLYVVFSESQNCQQTEQQAIIQFNGEFNVAPQVFIGLEHFNFDIGTDYRLQITTITTTNFQVITECPNTQIVSEIQFYWYAINDQRIQVINNFNMLSPQNKTFNHENVNAISGILSITSLGIEGNVDFQLVFSYINQTQVAVNITNVANNFINLKQIGYQIILGTDEAIQIPLTQHLTSNYTSGILTQQPNRWLYLSFVGFNMASNVKQKVQRTSVSVSYTVETFDLASFVACYHYRSWLAYKFTKVYKAFESQGIRFSQTYDKEVSTQPQFQIDITELPLSLSLNSETQKILNTTTNQLNFKIVVRCTQSKKIVSQFLKCQDCPSNKYYKFTHYCHGQIDQVIYYTKYVTSLSVYKELTFNLATDIFTIKQILYNQIKITQIILDISIVNQ
ncbi:unnamed protein product [Paramecium sonneborni]|uniref:H-type lectin domain-containing protein n=1 Tax=Paramecium sonneborni TaxID=65129 RepID=A0A8S1QIH9_9CILI|nr:unnamed protein product [Paramecium sonneborni]